MRWEGLNDYVTIIARQASKVLLLKEYSYPHDEWIWQFPEGIMDAGEEPATTANRELQEEAGLQAGSVVQIGMNYAQHRRTDQKNYIYLASEFTETTDAVADQEEIGIESHWFSTAEINTMIAAGEIRQKNTLAAWAIFLAQTDRI